VPQLSQHQARRAAYRIVASQFAIAGIIGFLFLIFAGAQAGMSAWIGGGISVIATYYQVRIAFSPRVFGDPRLMARALYVSEAVKIAVIVALFALALNWLELAGGPMMTAFASTLMVYFLALLWSPLSGNKDG
jgi:F0F1-type ATP synthase assembly protein I